MMGGSVKPLGFHCMAWKSPKKTWNPKSGFFGESHGAIAGGLLVESHVEKPNVGREAHCIGDLPTHAYDASGIMAIIR